MPIAQYLRDCGYRVLEAASVDEAMTILQKSDTHIDVVLSDVEMPGPMNGFGFAQGLAQFALGRRSSLQPARSAQPMLRRSCASTAWCS
jgi:CheY-like chemotaxis protein